MMVPLKPQNRGTTLWLTPMAAKSSIWLRWRRRTTTWVALYSVLKKTAAFLVILRITLAYSVTANRHLGPSSNIAFNRHISRATARLSRINHDFLGSSDSDSQRLQSETAVMSASRPSSPSGHRVPRDDGEDVNIYALPSEKRTRELIAQYFGDTGLLFPYIHDLSFWEAYNDMKKSNFTRVRRSWLGLLNMVMALATSTTINPDVSAEKRAQESDVYYQRGRGLCKKLMMRGTSLEIGWFGQFS